MCQLLHYVTLARSLEVPLIDTRTIDIYDSKVTWSSQTFITAIFIATLNYTLRAQKCAKKQLHNGTMKFIVALATVW